MKRFRGAIVGFGKVAAEAHAPGFRQAPGFAVVGAVDPSADRRQAADAVFGSGTAHATLESLLAAFPDLDFVDVATPPRFHASAVAEALRRGLHVLCEKPLAFAAEEARALRDEALARGRVLFTVHNWKYAPIFRRLGEELRAGTIGALREIEWNVLRPDPPRGAAEAGWRLDPAAAGGGILMDHGWHAAYLMPFLAGEAPTAVSATLESRQGLGVEDWVDLEIAFSEVSARVHLQWGGSERRTFGIVRGTDGTIAITDDRLTIERRERPAAQTLRFLPAISASSYHPEWFPPLLEDFHGEMLDPGRRGRNAAEAVGCADLLRVAYASGGRSILLPTS